jgi:hypothetical protein
VSFFFSFDIRDIIITAFEGPRTGFQAKVADQYGYPPLLPDADAYAVLWL